MNVVRRNLKCGWRTPGSIVAISLVCLFDAASLSVSAERRVTTDSGIPLDEPIQIRVRDVLLRVPAGYLWPWPDRSLRDRVNEWKALAFDFWMPDRRYLEINNLSLLSYRPKERGRDEPLPDAYVVEVTTLAPAKLEEPDYISPEKRFKNVTSGSDISSYSFQEEPFGLVRFWRNDWPYPKLEPFVDYRHRQGADPQVLLRCTPPREKVPNPSCMGEIHFVAEELGFFVRFSRDRLPEWRGIVDAVRDLFRSWKVGS
jgi:hypothetical protein